MTIPTATFPTVNGGRAMPRMTKAPHASSERPLRFHARSVRSAASTGIAGIGFVRAHLLEPPKITSTSPITATTDTTRAAMRGSIDLGSGRPSRHRPFVCFPVPVAAHRDRHTEHDQREPDEPSTAREVEGRQQLRDREACGEKTEGRANPGQERALVRVGEPNVGRGATVVVVFAGAVPVGHALIMARRGHARQ